MQADATAPLLNPTQYPYRRNDLGTNYASSPRRTLLHRQSRINAPRVGGSLTQIDIEAMHDNTAPAEYRETSISRFSPVGNLPRA